MWQHKGAVHILISPIPILLSVLLRPTHLTFSCKYDPVMLKFLSFNSIQIQVIYLRCNALVKQLSTSSHLKMPIFERANLEIKRRRNTQLESTKDSNNNLLINVIHSGIFQNSFNSSHLLTLMYLLTVLGVNKGIA